MADFGIMEGIALAGLIVGTTGAVMSYQASEEQAAEAENIADQNAARQEMEAEEMAQRAEEAASRETSLARAMAAASGADGESSDLYIEDLTNTKQREIDWIRRSGSSNADIMRREGKATGSGIRNQGRSDLISGLGGQVSAGGDWYNTYRAGGSAKNKDWNWTLEEQ